MAIFGQCWSFESSADYIAHYVGQFLDGMFKDPGLHQEPKKLYLFKIIVIIIQYNNTIIL